jgi:hypothetical protein
MRTAEVTCYFHHVHIVRWWHELLRYRRRERSLSIIDWRRRTDFRVLWMMPSTHICG